MIDSIFELKNKILVPYYQGLFDDEGRHIGSELLIRLNDPKLGILAPRFFLPDIEKAKLMTVVDLWSFKQAIAWQARHPQLHISCNISGQSLESDQFLSEICEYTAKNNSINVHKINIELTESSDIDDSAIEKAQMIVDLGYHLVLDDWGKEYSGFNRLFALPIHRVKIDKFLVDNLNAESCNLDNLSLSGCKAANIIGGMIEIANRLGIEVVAEGVEREEQFKLLKSLACNQFQGYYFQKPQPEADS